MEDGAIESRYGSLAILACSLLLAACGGGGGGGSAAGGVPPQQRGASGSELPENQPPSISGSPAMEVTAGSVYYFRPNASDADDTALSFGIRNRPRWATFNSATGRLIGTPGANDIGRYNDIRVSVTDGQDSAELNSFGITVLPDGDMGFTVRWKAPARNTDGTRLKYLAGYRVYLGRRSGAYSTIIEISDPAQTVYSFEQLAPGDYFVALTAVNGFGRESLPSREVNIRL